ncbi:MAG: hypothetical protein K0M45_03015 [Candidatus Paracaedibacteraceae bacterium]|nr:hypothetical protein [Candidatus Paracaedibacteraceae bacterium]
MEGRILSSDPDTLVVENPKSLADICFSYIEDHTVAAIKQKDYDSIEATLGRLPYDLAEKLFENRKFTYYFLSLLELYSFSLIDFKDHITFTNYERSSRCPSVIYNIFKKAALKTLQFLDSRALVYNYPFSPIPNHIINYFRENSVELFMCDGWITDQLIEVFSRTPGLKSRKLVVNFVSYNEAHQEYESLLEIARQDPNYDNPELMPTAQLNSNSCYYRREYIGYRIARLLKQMPNLESLVFYCPLPVLDSSQIVSVLDNNMRNLQSIDLIVYRMYRNRFPNIEAVCQQKKINLNIKYFY